MYNLHVTGKTPFHFLNAESNRTKYILPSNLVPCYCILLPPTGNTVFVSHHTAPGGSKYNTVLALV